jgi:hypothetical protein
MNKRPDFNLIEIDKMRKRKRRELSDLEKQEIQEAFKLFDTVRLSINKYLTHYIVFLNFFLNRITMKK